MYGISHPIAINPFAPSIMMSLGIAISFDYSLFLLTRFREVTFKGNISREECVYASLESSGHPVLLSGLTLLASFVLLIAFPQQFLQSVGWGCGAVVLSSLLSSLSLTPSLLLYFTCLSSFDLYPTTNQCCCWIRTVDDADGNGKITGGKMGNKVFIDNYDPANAAIVNGSTDNRVDVQENEAISETVLVREGKQSSSSQVIINTASACTLGVTNREGEDSNIDSKSNTNIGVLTPTINNASTIENDVLKDVSVIVGDNGVTTVIATTDNNDMKKISTTTFNHDHIDKEIPFTLPHHQKKMKIEGSVFESISCDEDLDSDMKEMISKHDYWFELAFFISKHPWIFIMVTLLITAPFLWQLLSITPTSDSTLIYLRGSTSIHGLKRLQHSFPVGQLDPYQVIVVTYQPNVLLTQEYFELEQNLIKKIFNEISSKYIDIHSINSISYFNSKYITYHDAIQYFNSSMPSYNSSLATSYRLSYQSLVNGDESASLIAIETIVNPDAQVIVPFIDDMRKLVKNFADHNKLNDQVIESYLFGGYTTTYDLQNLLYSLVAIMIACTMVIVLLIIGLNYGSVVLTIRLIVTLAISLCWTYGFMVIVYQPGPGQRAFAKLNPYILSSSGVYWIIPIMAFSILVGLALDYDIFLMSRFVEFRKRGWSDRISICLAIEKTGGIITAAGTIMSISFAGLLLMKSTVLNQYGFVLFLGVAIDTFYVRMVLVPAIIVVLDDNNYTAISWWPGIMPPVLLTPDEEDLAIHQGYWYPQLPQQIKNKIDE